MIRIMLRITQYGEPVLRQRGAPVVKFDRELAEFAGAMLETMCAHDGIGLAAQQAGRALRLFVVDLQSRTREAEGARLDGKAIPPALLFPMVVANPELELPPGPTRSVEEGCLSFPEIRGEITRLLAARMRYQDVRGQWHTIEASGLLARVLQHEHDHIEGVLFIDRMDPQHLATLERPLKELKKATQAALRRPRSGETMV